MEWDAGEAADEQRLKHIFGEENALRCFRSVPRDRNFGNAGIAENLLEILAQNRDLRYNTGTPEQQQDQDFIERILPCDFPDDISDCMTNVY